MPSGWRRLGDVVDRLPWWSWVLLGGFWAVAGGIDLATGDTARERLGGLLLAVLVPLGAFRGARRRRRGEPFLG